MLFYVLHVFENYCKFFFYNDLFARHDDCDSNETDVLESIIGWKYAFPNSKDIEKLKILSIEESDPSKAVEKGVYFQFLESTPYHGFDDLHIMKITTSI